jgi:phosphoglycolate phosphatase
MKQGITILFTGIRGTEIPLLYYASKYYEDKGFEKLLINCHMNSESDFDKTYEKAKEIIKGMDLSEYEKVILIAKSVGTVISCKIKEELNLKADLILFTPLEQTLPYIGKDNNIILVAAGDQDKFLQSEKLVDRCEAEKVNYYIEKGVGHRMEVTNDLSRCLEVVGNVLGRL